MKNPCSQGQTDEAAQACLSEIAIVHALTEAITTRWQEAQLEPTPGDDVKAGLAALEFLEAARDSATPWGFGDGDDSVIDTEAPTVVPGNRLRYT